MLDGVKNNEIIEFPRKLFGELTGIGRDAWVAVRSQSRTRSHTER